MPKKLRPLGEILLDLEPIIDEMIEGHDLQFGDVLGIVLLHLQVHHRGAQEEYDEGGHPQFFYGSEKESKGGKK